jgi:LysM repeat protein
MSLRRLAATLAAMAGIAAALHAIAPAPGAALVALSAPQHLVDLRGADALVIALAAVLAWAAWLWGAVGVVLTAAAALPGLAGSLSRALLTGVVPAGLRRAAGIALGAGVVLNGPLLAGVALAAPSTPTATATATTTATAPAGPATEPAVPDWPTGGADAPTPGAPAPAPPPADPMPTSTHVVVPGECLWEIADDQLRSAGQPISNAAVATTVHAWWSSNAQLIGPDPDLIRPGQALRPPTSP